jgi:tetraacyldisaccharide 4'-kinase
LLDLIYAQAARWRRQSAEHHPERRRRLARPVISVGNLSVGGSGKSPVVAAIAARLRDKGERPSILSRGYARADDADGVVVVSDGARLCAGIDRAGDEPLMLARQVPGAMVCVSPNRYLAGVLAERALGATVHVLDDGFQHFDLHRDLDILVTTPGEIPNGRVVPSGRLREPMEAASRAHLLVVMGVNAAAASAEAWTLGVSLSCGASRTLLRQVPVYETQIQIENPCIACPVLALSGIANPARFADDLREAGHPVTQEIVFPDHHRYTAGDIARIAAEVKRHPTMRVFTTDKDAVRLEAFAPLPFSLYRVPLALAFDPPDAIDAAVDALLARRAGEPGA